MPSESRVERHPEEMAKAQLLSHESRCEAAEPQANNPSAPTSGCTGRTPWGRAT